MSTPQPSAGGEPEAEPTPSPPASSGRPPRVGPRAVVLAVVVFLSGAALLGVEIAASRVLAPTFGSSLYVWGSLIGIVLTGLAVGYALGGWLADRLPSISLLVVVLIVGAATVLAIPLVDGWVIRGVTDWDPGPRLNPFVAAAALFGPMSVVLAGVTPIAVRLAAQSLEKLGRTAGRLFSISTAGSIVGTFATAFWLVPSFGTDQVIAFSAVGLLVAAALLGLIERRWVVGFVATLGLAGALTATAVFAPEAQTELEAREAKNWSPLVRKRETRTPRKLDPAAVESFSTGFRVREARDTRYHRMLIAEDEESRFMRFDSSFQSGMWLRDPYETRFAYSDYLQVALAYKPDARKVLVIGLGGAAAPKRMWRDFSDLEITAVELDPDVVDAAYRWFEMPRDPRLKVEVSDGRTFLRESEERWDVIMVDAFYSDGVPFHLTTLEFARLLRDRLVPGGVVATNVIGALRGDGSRFTRALVKTYHGAFPTVELHPVFDGPNDRFVEDIRNIILVATEQASPTRRRLAESWAETRQARAPKAPLLKEAIADRWVGSLPTDDVPFLTDSYAPTDALLLDGGP